MKYYMEEINAENVNNPEAKKMREEEKAARPKCTINGCGGNEYSYGLCVNHYGKSKKDAKAKKTMTEIGRVQISQRSNQRNDERTR